jgi:ATP-dependent RNA helicase DeaD
MTTFEELGVRPDILQALGELGFEFPMPVQEAVIPRLLNDSGDIIALAQTGTGKTAAFGLPIIQKIDVKDSRTQALILSPTRELCVQIADDLRDYSKYVPGLKVLPIYGGASIENQMYKLRQGVHVIVATPGRLIDMIQRNSANIEMIDTLVLDEADEMLNMGFAESLNTILEYVPESRSTLLFSATMPQQIAHIARKYMKKPEEVVVGTKNSGSENVRHVVYFVNQKDKYLTLKRIADYYPDIYGIVFCRTRRETQEIADMLIADGYNAESLHGELSQGQRDMVMKKFRNKQVQLLAATDVAARGIDVDNLSHIINYNLPDDNDTYNHRSGRTGRAGKKGISILIANPRDKRRIKMIEDKIGKKFEITPVPSGYEVCEKQLFKLVDKVEKVEIEHKEIEPYLPALFKKLEWLDKEELISRFISLEFNRFIQYYKSAPDLNVKDDRRDRDGGRDRDFGSRDRRDSRDRGERGDRRDGRDRRDRDGGRDRGERGDRRDGRDRRDRDDRRDGESKTHYVPQSGFTEMYINLGKRDGIFPDTLIDLIVRQSGLKKIKIGKIDIYKNHTVLQTETEYNTELLASFKGARMDDRSLVMKIDGDASSRTYSDDSRRNSFDDEPRKKKSKDDRDKKPKKDKKKK